MNLSLVVWTYMLIQSIPGSSNTTFHDDLVLAKFEAMDLDAYLLKLEKPEMTPNKSKSKAVDKALGKIWVWQSTDLHLEGGKYLIDQLMKNLDILQRENVATQLILEISLGLARDVAIAVKKYKDLEPSLEIFEFWNTTHEANLVDYQKQKSKLDQMVHDFKSTK